jgi:hypothetical protein
MKKTKSYNRTLFSPEVIKQGLNVFERQTGTKRQNCTKTLVIRINGEKWEHDSEEEFFADYRRNFSYARYSLYPGDSLFSISVGNKTEVEVQAKTRSQVEVVFDVSLHPCG